MSRKDCIYLIRCGESNFYKIGTSYTPEKRIRTLQIGCPYSLILVYKLSPTLLTPAEMENMLHKKLWDKRKQGEWYKLTKDEVKRVIELLSLLAFP